MLVCYIVSFFLAVKNMLIVKKIFKCREKWHQSFTKRTTAAPNILELNMVARLSGL